MHKVVVQEGYSLPFESFGAAKRKKRKTPKRRGKKTLKGCARAWKKKSAAFKKRRKYTAFIKKCMKVGRRRKKC